MAIATPGGIDIWFDGTRWMAALYGQQTPVNYTADQIASGVQSGAFRMVGTQVSPDVAAKLAARQVPLAQAQPLGLRPATPAQPAYNGPVGGAQSGSITAPRPQGASPFGERQPDGTIRAPDGAILSPTGAVISRSAAQPAATMVAPQPQAAPVPPERGNNQDAALVNGAWNVDPAVQRARTAGPPPAASTPAPAPALPLNAEFAGSDYTDPTLRAVWDQFTAPQPLGALQPFAQGGMMGADTGMQPNALVGEGQETETEQFDQPTRTELVMEPTGKPSTYTVYWVEGATPTALKGGTVIVPLPNSLEAEMKSQFLPLDQMPMPKDEEVAGDLRAYRGGGLVPTMRPPMPQRPALYDGGSGGMRGAA